MDKLIARKPNEVETWPQVTLLTEPEIVQAEHKIIPQLEGLGLNVFSPWYSQDGTFHRLKHIVCRHTDDLKFRAFTEGGIQELEQANADYYNDLETYGDNGGFAIQIAKPVAASTEKKKMADDKKRWKTGKTDIKLDANLIGTVYVEIHSEETLHPSVQTSSHSHPWGYVDIICSAQSQQFRNAGIGIKLMQLALLGLMRRGITHVALDSVRSAVSKYLDWGFEVWTTISHAPDLTLMVLKSIMDGWSRMQALDNWYARDEHERKGHADEQYHQHQERGGRLSFEQFLKSPNYIRAEGLGYDTEQESEEDDEERQYRRYLKYREKNQKMGRDSLSFEDWLQENVFDLTKSNARTRKRVRKSTKGKHKRRKK
jgi:hypothetical protein